jgi:hypothetical protein
MKLSGSKTDGALDPTSVGSFATLVKDPILCLNLILLLLALASPA